METETTDTIKKDTGFKALMDKIAFELKGGLKHGFFKYEIKGERLQASGKSAVTLEAGKCYRFHVPPEEIKEL